MERGGNGARAHKKIKAEKKPKSLLACFGSKKGVNRRFGSEHCNPSPGKGEKKLPIGKTRWG